MQCNKSYNRELKTFYYSVKDFKNGVEAQQEKGIKKKSGISSLSNNRTDACTLQLKYVRITQVI